MNEGDRASALYPSSPPSFFSPPVSLRLPEQASGSVEAYIGGGGVPFKHRMNKAVTAHSNPRPLKPRIPGSQPSLPSITQPRHWLGRPQTVTNGHL
ncbi:Hypothetical predicted protein [Scomber scombrus]|uniref:Uncharacterized protein n=1 Tax=Scomber scombrus TaxID=13677 RepID=A0AAV1P124_SCOSC